MTSLRSLAGLLVLLASTSLPAAAQFTARQVFDAWIEAFNANDPARHAAFEAAHQPQKPFAANAPLRDATGGFTVLRYEKESPTEVEALVQEKNSDTVGRATLAIADGQGKMSGFGIRIVPRPADLAIKRVPAEEAVRLTADRVDAMAKDDRFAGVVLVARGNKVLLEHAVGLADRESKQPISPDTRFRIGSMNKMFTSVAILQLVEQGKLALDDPVGKHLADYPNKDVAAKVSIRHLLTHSGGTGDIFGPEYRERRLELKTLGDYAKLYGARGLDHEPGATFRYSNYGFVLLGLIVEKASGMTYYDYVRERIFVPAGMTGTDSLPESDKVTARSMGYMKREGRWRSNVDTLPFRGTSAGGGYSTARDLLRFAQALESGKLLPPARLAEATRSQVKATLGGYGFGFIVAGEGDLRRYGHGGGAPGMNGELRVYPQSGYVVVVLSNLDPPAATQVADFFDQRTSGS